MNTTIVKSVMFILMLSTVTAVNATSVGTGGVGTAFSKNSTSFSLTLGSGSSFNDNYTILGVGIGYYLVNGLELGIDVQHWFSGDPSITKVSPQVKYVFTRMKTIKPYVGAFYRRVFISDLDDTDSYGYRAGAYFSSNKGVYVGGGIVYEEYKDCRVGDCSNTYPEVLMSFSF